MGLWRKVEGEERAGDENQLPLLGCLACPVPLPQTQACCWKSWVPLRTIGDSLLSLPIHKTLSLEVRRELLRKERLLIFTSELE